jgi:hypothetical protein
MIAFGMVVAAGADDVSEGGTMGALSDDTVVDALIMSDRRCCAGSPSGDFEFIDRMMHLRMMRAIRAHAPTVKMLKITYIAQPADSACGVTVACIGEVFTFQMFRTFSIVLTPKKAVPKTLIPDTPTVMNP